MKLVRLDSLFEISTGSNLELNKLTQVSKEGIPYVAMSSQNIGVTAYVKEVKGVKTESKNTLSVALQGSVLSTFYQSYPYYTSTHVVCLKPKNLSEVEVLYYQKCIRKNKFRYSYGRKANSTLASLMLPAREEIPQWVYETKLPDYNLYKEAKLKISEEERLKLWKNINWKKFELIKYFKFVKGNSITSLWMSENPGNINCISALAKNNGQTAKINPRAALQKRLPIYKNILSISTNGTYSGTSFVQNNLCVITNNAAALIPLVKLSNLQKLFISKMINKESFRFSYTRTVDETRVSNLSISLPSKKDGKPDWDLIEELAASSNWTNGL